MRQYVYIGMLWWQILKGQMNMVISFYFYFHCMLWIYKLHPESFLCFLTVVHRHNQAIFNQMAVKMGAQCRLFMESSNLINKEMLHGIKPFCASVSAWLLPCMLFKFELAEGYQEVLQSHSWLHCRHTCREELAQERPNSVIHMATSDGERALPRSSPLPYSSALLDFYLAVQ